VSVRCCTHQTTLLVAGFEVNASLRWLMGPVEDGRLALGRQLDGWSLVNADARELIRLCRADRLYDVEAGLATAAR
jgi:hypothetical protein